LTPCQSTAEDEELKLLASSLSLQLLLLVLFADVDAPSFECHVIMDLLCKSDMDR